jgi:hypothetical protein
VRRRPVRESFARYGDYANDAATFGYSFSDTSINSGAPFFATALDKTTNRNTKAPWITGGTYACHRHLAGALREVSRLR